MKVEFKEYVELINKYMENSEIEALKKENAELKDKLFKKASDRYNLYVELLKYNNA